MFENAMHGFFSVFYPRNLHPVVRVLLRFLMHCSSEDLSGNIDFHKTDYLR